MSTRPALTHLSVALLIGEAGSDPWQIDQTLQSGSPGEIAALSRAFFDAGACTEETYRDFTAAQKRFRAAWTRDDGSHPIDDGAEVRRALDSLLFHRDQLPVVAAELAGIAAALAEAQKSSSGWIDSLNTELRYVDRLIGEALAHRQHTAALEDRAVDSTTIVATQVMSLRDTYAANLAAAQTNLRLDSRYDPAIDDVDGAGPAQRGADSLGYYDRNHRARDETLAGQYGDRGAADRLRDYRTATDPAADDQARTLAAERLDDFRMSGFVGPLPTDPVLGGDARTRARTRVDIQRRLETGVLGLPVMTADEATRSLDDAEHAARVLTAHEAVNALTGLGMSRAGARRCVDLLSRGEPIRELLNQESATFAAVESGTNAAIRSLPTGRHALERFTDTDVRVLGGVARGAKVGGFGIDAVTGLWDLRTGQTTPLGLAGRLAGGAAVGWGAETAAWALAGSFIGPEGALAAGVIASLLFSGAASDAGERVLSELGS